MNSIRKMFYACVLCTILLQSVCKGDSKTEGYLVNVSKLLAGALDEVTDVRIFVESNRKSRKDVDTLQTAAFGEGYHAEGLPNNKHEPTRNKSVTASISVTEGDEIVFRIDYELGNVVNANWMVNFLMQPETKYKQVWEPGHLFMVTPSTDLLLGRVFSVVANIGTGSGEFQYHFNLSTADELVKAPSGLTKNSGIVREDNDLYTLTVSPSTNIGYTPGDEIVLFIDVGSRSSSEISWSFMAVSNKSDDPFAVVRYRYDLNAPVSISTESKSGKLLKKATIDTTLLKTGGIVILRDKAPFKGRVIRKLFAVQRIYLHLRTQTAPIPINRVAIDKSAYSADQKMDLANSETPVRCEAIGNPAPYMEFRIGGHAVQAEYGEWPWAYGNSITAYIPNNLLHDKVTCRAESGTAVAEMAIRIHSDLYIVDELSGMKRISDNLTEAICTARGNPAPTISFFKGSNSPSNLFTEDQDNVEIITSTTDYTTTSKLILDSPDFDQLWYVICSIESNGRTTWDKNLNKSYW